MRSPSRSECELMRPAKLNRAKRSLLGRALCIEGGNANDFIALSTLYVSKLSRYQVALTQRASLTSMSNGSMPRCIRLASCLKLAPMERHLCTVENKPCPRCEHGAWLPLLRSPYPSQGAAPPRPDHEVPERHVDSTSIRAAKDK
jgi:hypothetical protein